MTQTLRDNASRAAVAHNFDDSIGGSTELSHQDKSRLCVGGRGEGITGEIQTLSGHFLELNTKLRHGLR